MCIANAISQNQFFWDIRASDLEKQVMMPIENHIEMGVELLSSIPPKLSTLSYYPPF
ncbi:MAG: cytochrome c peroxidase [Saprospiraceae bacterium]